MGWVGLGWIEMEMKETHQQATVDLRTSFRDGGVKLNRLRKSKVEKVVGIGWNWQRAIHHVLLFFFDAEIITTFFTFFPSDPFLPCNNDFIHLQYPHCQ